MNDKYEIKRIEGTDLYRVICDGVEIADGVTFCSAVVMVENTMYCGGERIATAPTEPRNDKQEGL